MSQSRQSIIAYRKSASEAREIGEIQSLERLTTGTEKDIEDLLVMVPRWANKRKNI